MPAGLSARLALAALLVATGCASLGGAGSVPRALAPAGAAGDRTFQQILRIERGDRQQRLIAAGELCGTRLALSLLTPEGLEVLRVRQRGTSVEVRRRRGLPAGLSARAVLADLQLVHWPADALRGAWGPRWRLEAPERARRVLRDGDLRVRVRYADAPWQGPVTVEHLAQGYRVHVTTLEHRPRDPGEGRCKRGADEP